MSVSGDTDASGTEPCIARTHSEAMHRLNEQDRAGSCTGAPHLKTINQTRPCTGTPRQSSHTKLGEQQRKVPPRRRAKFFFYFSKPCYHSILYIGRRAAATKLLFDVAMFGAMTKGFGVSLRMPMVIRANDNLNGSPSIYGTQAHGQNGRGHITFSSRVFKQCTITFKFRNDTHVRYMHDLTCAPHAHHIYTRTFIFCGSNVTSPAEAGPNARSRGCVERNVLSIVVFSYDV